MWEGAGGLLVMTSGANVDYISITALIPMSTCSMPQSLIDYKCLCVYATPVWMFQNIE